MIVESNPNSKQQQQNHEREYEYEHDDEHEHLHEIDFIIDKDDVSQQSQSSSPSLSSVKKSSTSVQQYDPKHDNDDIDDNIHSDHKDNDNVVVGIDINTSTNTKSSSSRILQSPQKQRIKSLDVAAVVSPSISRRPSTLEIDGILVNSSSKLMSAEETQRLITSSKKYRSYDRLSSSKQTHSSYHDDDDRQVENDKDRARDSDDGTHIHISANTNSSSTVDQDEISEQLLRECLVNDDEDVDVRRTSKFIKQTNNNHYDVNDRDISILIDSPTSESISSLSSPSNQLNDDSTNEHKQDSDLADVESSTNSTTNTRSSTKINMTNYYDDDEDDEEDEPASYSAEETRAGGSLSDGAAPANRRPLRLMSKYRKKIRRNADVGTQLQKFRRIRKHNIEELPVHTNEIDELLYDTGASSEYNPPITKHSNEDTNNTQTYTHAHTQTHTIKHPLKSYRLSAYCTCESYQLSDIIEFLEESESFDGTLTLYGDVLHIRQKALMRDAFIFTYGCVVFFNFSQSKEFEFLRFLKRWEVGTLPAFEIEDFDFSYGNESRVGNDEVILATQSSLEKLSVGFALAQCVKLNIYENRIAKEIEDNKQLPQSLAKYGSIGLSRNEISRRIGKLFIERNNVNLHFDLLDAPEFFWQQDKFKHVYDRLFNYLELGKRVELLNKRLDIIQELFNMLSDQLENSHAHKLEWIVIWLIVLEVLISVVKDVMGV